MLTQISFYVYNNQLLTTSAWRNNVILKIVLIIIG